MTPRKIATTIASAAALVALTGCSNDEPTEAKASDTPAATDTMPKCDEVWQVGQTLPEDYAGCEDGDTIVDIAFTGCKDDRRMYVHRASDGSTKTHIAITGTAIQAWTEELNDSVYATCQPS